MKILYIAHRIPFPPTKGDKIRSFHEIMHLAKRHEVHLVALCDDKDDVGYAKDLKRYCRTVSLIPVNPWVSRVKAAAAMASGRPFTLGYFDSSAMKQAIRQRLGQHRFDAVLVYCSSVAPYVEELTGPLRILDFVDSDACKWKQYAEARKGLTKWVYRLEAERLKRYESRLIDEFDLCAFVSAREADHLPARQRNKVVFVQNGIDLEFFRPELKNRESHDIVFTGVMDYFPNVDAVTFFARDVFPAVRKRFPDARFLIVGSNPVPSVKRLASLPGVTVTGTVPDVRPFLAGARLSVAPLRISQGIQNKILQALAAGLPVVASPNAAAALTDLENVPLTIARDAEGFVAAITRWFERPPLDLNEIQSCQDYLQTHHRWSTNLDAFERAIELSRREARHRARQASSVMPITIGSFF